MTQRGLTLLCHVLCVGPKNGVVRNSYYNMIQNEVTMDDLF